MPTIKSCLQCEAEFKTYNPPEISKYCSRACKTKSQTVGRSMGEYNCKLCGRLVIRGANDARRQSYCSRSCALRGAVPDPVLKSIDDRFGFWLAGLTDGEANFELNSNGSRSGIRFCISLRMDDRPLLEEIQEKLGIGTIYDTYPSQVKRNTNIPVNPKSQYMIDGFKECLALKSVFDRYPLKSKKLKDFDLWSTALGLMGRGEATKESLSEIERKLREGRKYSGPSEPS